MIDRILRFFGIVATITLVALGAAVLTSGEWDAWKAVRDARPDLAVVELKAEAQARDARIEAAEAGLAEARAEIAALTEALAAAQAEVGALREAAAAETARVDAALAERAAFGDALRIAPAEGEGVLGLAPGGDGTPGPAIAETGNWRLLKAEQ